MAGKAQGCFGVIFLIMAMKRLRVEKFLFCHQGKTNFLFFGTYLVLFR